MGKFFFIAAMVSILAVLGSLLSGLWQMSGEGAEKRIKSNKMMQLRVFLQACALLFLALAAMFSGKN